MSTMDRIANIAQYRRIQIGADYSKGVYVITPDATGNMENTMILSYHLFQSCLIWIGLGTGIICMLHLLYTSLSCCRNVLLVFITIFTGFLHVVTCIYILIYSESMSKIRRHPSVFQPCIDYTAPATLANIICLVAITISMLHRNLVSSFKRIAASVYLVISCACASVLLRRMEIENPTSMMQAERFASIGDDTSSSLDMNWSVCLKFVDRELYRLLFEYLLIYTPVLVITAVILRQKRHTLKGAFNTSITFVDERCRDKECAYSHCVASRLNNTFWGILWYSLLLMFVGRPALILYGYLTTGMFRDILPSLLQTVVYCFLCSEYIMFLIHSQFKKQTRSTYSQTQLV